MTARFFALDRLCGDADRLSRAFRAASPFPHVVVDNCLRLDPASLETFPDECWPHWRRLGHYEPGKVSCQERRVMPEPWGALVDELNAPPALAALERVTGIRKLIPDPYLEGGGLHASGPGGRLGMHTDFHVYARLDLFRRINLILYLCPEWKDANGGALELTHAKRGGRATVLPAWGRCVIFETNDTSVHGFMRPVAPGQRRRSIALYYYTAHDAATFSGDGTTHWREHGAHDGFRRVRHAAFRGLMLTSRAFSVAAHVANPHQGLDWYRDERAKRSGRGAAQNEWSTDSDGSPGKMP
jgi:hypothetical protein